MAAAAAASATVDAPVLWAAADVSVAGLDVEVALTLQPGVAINGRVVFEGARPSPAELQSLSFRLMPPGSGGQLLSSGGGRVDAEDASRSRASSPTRINSLTSWTTPGASEKWTIKSSVANGRDAFETPLRVIPNEPVDWTVTFTDTPATLTGVLQDGSGRGAPAYFILVFSADRQHWTPGSRRVRHDAPGHRRGIHRDRACRPASTSSPR